MFSNCTTPHDIKKLYRKLAMENHPDLGGSTRKMQDINAAYLAALAIMNGHVSTGSDGRERTYRYNETVEQAIMDKISELLRTLPSYCTVELIGLWIWVRDTRRDDAETRKALKNAKMRWNGKRSAWYWKPYKNRATYNPRASLDDLASYYGARTFTPKDETQTAAVSS